ncbi:MAG: hypothetical protein LBM96_06990 [Methanobrevibacter sp.]|nr:hypothetical protein [Candidatus Methanoflexus mossambicus]
MEKQRKITYSAYKIGNKTALVCAVYKTENAPKIKDTLIKLMQSEIKEKNDKKLCN